VWERVVAHVDLQAEGHRAADGHAVPWSRDCTFLKWKLFTRKFGVDRIVRVVSRPHQPHKEGATQKCLGAFSLQLRCPSSATVARGRDDPAAASARRRVHRRGFGQLPAQVRVCAVRALLHVRRRCKRFPRAKGAAACVLVLWSDDAHGRAAQVPRRAESRRRSCIPAQWRRQGVLPLAWRGEEGRGGWGRRRERQ